MARSKPSLWSRRQSVYYARLAVTHMNAGALPLAAIDVRNEETDPGVQVAGIDRQRIARCQLLYGELRLNPVEASSKLCKIWHFAPPLLAVDAIAYQR